jgi:hypothetical protein
MEPNYKPARHNIPEQHRSQTLKLLGLISTGQYTVPNGTRKYTRTDFLKKSSNFSLKPYIRTIFMFPAHDECTE